MHADVLDACMQGAGDAIIVQPSPKAGKGRRAVRKPKNGRAASEKPSRMARTQEGGAPASPGMDKEPSQAGSAPDDRAAILPQEESSKKDEHPSATAETHELKQNESGNNEDLHMSAVSEEPLKSPNALTQEAPTSSSPFPTDEAPVALILSAQPPSTAPSPQVTSQPHVGHSTEQEVQERSTPQPSLGGAGFDAVDSIEQEAEAQEVSPVSIKVADCDADPIAAVPEPDLQADVHEADMHQAAVHEADEHQADVHEADEHQVDEHQADVRQADVRQADEHQTDQQQADMHQGDEHQTDEHQADQQQADQQLADQQQADVHQTDAQEEEEEICLVGTAVTQPLPTEGPEGPSPNSAPESTGTAADTTEPFAFHPLARLSSTPENLPDQTAKSTARSPTTAVPMQPMSPLVHCTPCSTSVLEQLSDIQRLRVTNSPLVNVSLGCQGQAALGLASSQPENNNMAEDGVHPVSSTKERPTPDEVREEMEEDGVQQAMQLGARCKNVGDESAPTPEVKPDMPKASNLVAAVRSFLPVKRPPSPLIAAGKKHVKVNMV